MWSDFAQMTEQHVTLKPNVTTSPLFEISSLVRRRIMQ